VVELKGDKILGKSVNDKLATDEQIKHRGIDSDHQAIRIRRSAA
jgi:hypothetical protein